MKINDTDRLAATETIEAVHRADRSAFDAVFDATVERYNGLARLVWALADRTNQ